MTTTLQRRLLALSASAAAAFGVWKFCPGTALDRAAFSTVAGGFANPPFFVEGRGTHAAPWRLRTFSAQAGPDKKAAPPVVSLGDDVDGFFQASLPAPIDFAVVFSNFHRYGITKAASSAVMAWEEADPIGFAALEKSLAKFDSLVVAAPLSRGVAAAPLPAAFRRASVPLSALRGPSGEIPTVNRIPLPGVMLGGDNALAGFSVLESDQGQTGLPLLARWDDRVVFAFPLLVAMQRLDVRPENLEIRPGSFLRLGPGGPAVPIDGGGRLALPLKPLPGRGEVRAESVVGGGTDLFPKDAFQPVILRDDRSAAEPATRAFSKSLTAAVSVLASEEGLAPARTFRWLTEGGEACLLAAVVLLLTGLAGAADFKRHLGGVLIAGMALGAQWIALGTASLWLPGLPVLAATAAALLVSLCRGAKPSAPPPATGHLASPPPPEPEPAPVEPVPEKPAKSRSTKSAEPKTPAKKTAARKTAAKTAKKAAPKKTAAPKTPRKGGKGGS